MGFLKKIFGGGGGSIEGLRKAIAQQRFSDARLFAEQLAGQSLVEAEVVEVERLRIIARDGLAELNLNEALGLQCCGDFEQAADHLRLAQEQVCSADLREKIEQTLAAEPLVPEIDSADVEHSGSCATCFSQPRPLQEDEESMPADTEIQLELILTSYPDDLAERYLTKSETFKAAFLLSHAGQDEQALPLWQQVEKADQDDLYWFELGALLARNGNLKEALSSLEMALEANPEMLLAIEALIPVLIATGDFRLAEERLQQFLSQGIVPSFCHAQLTSLYVQQKKYPLAAEHARQSLAAGNDESGFMLLAASVLEHVGALGETENVLQRLPAAGCRGGTNLPLAEFWLRQKRELGNILDTFNAACREYPDEPRWQLRVAQTYLARNWVKDGLKLLRKLVDDPRLESDLAEEAKKLLAEQKR